MSQAKSEGVLREYTSALRCPVTGRPCVGDLAHLCEDYGCVRKAGLSPHAAENL